MAAAAVPAIVDSIVATAKLVQQLGGNWYKANREWEDFPRKVNHLRERYDLWKCELHRHGMLSQNHLNEKLQNLQLLLLKEETRLKREEQKRRRGWGASQYTACWKKLSLTAFPGELTARIENVLNILNEIPGILEERRQANNVLVDASSALPCGLPFGPDKRYVPLEHAEAGIRNALESRQRQEAASTPFGPLVVVLHGGPGSGKTALAKSTALYYYDDRLDQLSGNLAEAELFPPHKYYFLDGVFYLACGPEADVVTKHFELLQLLGLPAVTLPTEISKTYTEAALHKQLMGYLKDKSMLIILDDVWEADLLERLVVPSRTQVKYLVTSQNANLWRNALKVPIGNVCLEDARRILASHVELANATIPPHLQEVADKFIAETGANPLALANLATTIGSKRSTDLDEWNTSVQDLFILLDSEDKDTVPIFNMRYPRSFPSSMTLAVDSLPEETRKLLILATMFDGPAVPEIVILILYQSICGGTGRFTKWRNDLEDRALIEVQSACPSWTDSQQRTWSIHGLRKRFIQARYQEVVSSFADSLIKGQESEVIDINDAHNNNLVSTLCVLYGEKEWAEKGAKKLGIQNLSSLRRSAIEPIVLLLKVGLWKQPFEESFLLARKVFLRYVCHDEVDEDSICKLLKSPDKALPTCRAVRCLASVSADRSILTYESQGIMKGLVALLEQGVERQIQESAVRALVNLSSKDFHMKKIVAFPGVLGRLAGLLRKGIPRKSQMWSAWTLANLAVDDENKTKIASTPGVLEGLGYLLNSNVNVYVQEQATRALAALAYSSKNKNKMAEIPEILTGLMRSLFKEENPGIQEHSAMALGNLAGAQDYKLDILSNMRKVKEFFPSAVLQRLVDMLAIKDNPGIQEQAAMALANFAGASRKIVLTIDELPDAVKRLVGLLSKTHSLGVQERAAMAVANLSVYWSKVWSESLSEQYNNRKIFHLIDDFPKALPRLVELLSQYENPVMQEHAAMTLANLAKAPYNKQKIAEFPHALERLADLLSNSESPPEVQQHAARAFGNLATAEEDDPDAQILAATTRTKTLALKGAVEGLARLQLLADGKHRAVQIEAEDTLRILDPSKVSNKQLESDFVNIEYRLGSGMPGAAEETHSWISSSLSRTSPTY